MSTDAPRRTITGLPPRTVGGNARLIRSNRDRTALALAPVTEPERPSLFEQSAGSDAPTVSPAEPPLVMATAGLPKYQQLRRREARVHEGQVEPLARLTRQVNKARRRPDGTMAGERITDNTLLRVAIDLLLARADELNGTTEEELAASLGLQRRS